MLGAVCRDRAGAEKEEGRESQAAPHPPRAPPIWGDKTGLQPPVKGYVSQALSSGLDWLSSCDLEQVGPFSAPQEDQGWTVGPQMSFSLPFL